VKSEAQDLKDYKALKGILETKAMREERKAILAPKP
jgi:hypothetical protein